jgi:shikimate dehydrogenase
MPRIAYLVGKGVSHSLSPPVYRAAFAAADIDAHYELLDVDEPDLPLAASALRAPDSLGGNVTMPYKCWATEVADDVDETVRACGAANLLVPGPSGLHAHNTDALAIAELLGTVRERISKGTVLLAGAGGAAAACAWALGRVPPRELIIAARRPEAGRALARSAAESSPSTVISVVELATVDTRTTPVDLVINATPLGMLTEDEDPLPSVAFSPSMLLYDLVYRRSGPTAIQIRAAAGGALVVDGIGHLFQQAMPTFRHLTGQEPPHDVMLAALVEVVGRQPALWSADTTRAPSDAD